MSDKSVKILLGIIALNLTYQSLIMPVAGDVQRVAICDIDGYPDCADVDSLYGLMIQNSPFQNLTVEIDD